MEFDMTSDCDSILFECILISVEATFRGQTIKADVVTGAIQPNYNIEVDSLTPSGWRQLAMLGADLHGHAWMCDRCIWDAGDRVETVRFVGSFVEISAVLLDKNDECTRQPLTVRATFEREIGT
jgi:hypothetical protein